MTMPKKVGRPKMAKGKSVPVRFNAEDLKKVTAPTPAKHQTVFESVRERAKFRFGGLDGSCIHWIRLWDYRRTGRLSK
jgi:hypothetical protein